MPTRGASGSSAAASSTVAAAAASSAAAANVDDANHANNNDNNAQENDRGGAEGGAGATGSIQVFLFVSSLSSSAECHLARSSIPSPNPTPAAKAAGVPGVVAGGVPELAAVGRGAGGHVLHHLRAPRGPRRQGQQQGTARPDCAARPLPTHPPNQPIHNPRPTHSLRAPDRATSGCRRSTTTSGPTTTSRRCSPSRPCGASSGECCPPAPVAGGRRSLGCVDAVAFRRACMHVCSIRGMGGAAWAGRRDGEPAAELGRLDTKRSSTPATRPAQGFRRLSRPTHRERRGGEGRRDARGSGRLHAAQPSGLTCVRALVA